MLVGVAMYDNVSRMFCPVLLYVHRVGTASSLGLGGRESMDNRDERSPEERV